MAGTFTVLGLLILGAGIALCLFMARKARRAKMRAFDEKFVEVSPFADPTLPSVHGRNVSTSSTFRSAEAHHDPLGVPNSSQGYFYQDYHDDTAFYTGSDDSHNQPSTQDHQMFAHTPTNVYLPAAVAEPQLKPPTPSRNKPTTRSSPSPTNMLGQTTSPTPSASTAQQSGTGRYQDSPTHDNENPFLGGQPFDASRDSVAYQPSVDSFFAAH